MVHSGFQAAAHLVFSGIGDPSGMRDGMLKRRPLDCVLLLEWMRQGKRDSCFAWRLVRKASRSQFDSSLERTSQVHEPMRVGT